MVDLDYKGFFDKRSDVKAQLKELKFRYMGLTATKRNAYYTLVGNGSAENY